MVSSTVARSGTSIAEDLGRAHETVLQDLRKLREAVAPAPGQPVQDLRTRLAAARKDIAEHFRFEEQNGYLEIVKKREPRLERAIEHLVQEHQELLDALDALINGAILASKVNENLRQNVQTWLKRVARH
jgi:hypothetical protein